MAAGCKGLSLLRAADDCAPDAARSHGVGGSDAVGAALLLMARGMGMAVSVCAKVREKC